jgi:hypothetical protein
MRQKRRHILWAYLTGIYFVAAAVVTIWSVQHYQKNLPAVFSMELTSEADISEDTVEVPACALKPEDGNVQFYLYSIREEEGAWGKQYFVVENEVLCFEADGDMSGTDLVPVVCLAPVNGPVIVKVERDENIYPVKDDEDLYEGEEIRLASAGVQ